MTAGLAALARPTLAAFGLVALLGLAARAPRRGALVAAVVLVAIAAPWTLRNAAVLGSTGPFAPYNCLVLWMGNNPNAGGGTLARDGRSVFEAMPEQMRSRLEGRTEVEQGQVFCGAAIEYMASDPVRTLGWWGQKFAYFWWFGPHAGVFYRRGWLDVYRVAYGIELALVIIGLAAVWRAGPRLGLLVVLAQLLIVALSQSFFYVEGRHRLLLEPSLAALAAAGVVTAGRLLRRLRYWRSA